MGLTWEDFQLTAETRNSMEPIKVSRSNEFAMVNAYGEYVSAYYEIWRMGGGDGYIADICHYGHGGHTLGEFPSLASARIACQGEFDGP